MKLPHIFLSEDYYRNNFDFMFTEKFCAGSFICYAQGFGKNLRLKFIVSHDDSFIVHFQKHEGSHGAYPLIAIHKRVILNDVEKISSSHLEQVRMQKRSTKYGLGLCQGRF